MKETDKPIGDVTKAISNQRIMANVINCNVCRSTDCYDLVMHGTQLVKLAYTRNNNFVCKRCHLDYVGLQKLVDTTFNAIVWCRRKLEREAK